MKVEKGGISREIDERNLAEYKEKGYAEVKKAKAVKAVKNEEKIPKGEENA